MRLVSILSIVIGGISGTTVSFLYLRRVRRKNNPGPRRFEETSIANWARAERRLTDAVNERISGALVIPFGRPDNPGRSLFMVAVQSISERMRAEGELNVSSILRQILVEEGYSPDCIARMRFHVKSEEEHGIFTWMYR